MAGSTTYYGLSYFTYGDDLGDGINVQREIDRFLIIDKQLFGLYSIFGDGVINGWDISPRATSGVNTISLDISSGVGIITSLAVQTDSVSSIEDLPSNDSFYIYAVVSGGTVRTRDVLFLWDRTIPTKNAVLLGRVTTGDSSIIGIDLSFRQEISFLEFIKDEVNKHKHRGTPTKIDLQTETRNQLPGARIEDFDAEKISTGRFSPQRIPQLDHNELSNTGLLSHAALDSFARLITAGNRQLLGEISAVNTLKQITAAYYLADKLNININDVVDYPNVYLCYPGITPNSSIDLDSTTANINTETNCISGKPIQQGTINSILWNTNAAFYSSIERKNITIARNTITLTRGGSSSSDIENFEQVPRAGVPIPGFTSIVQINTNKIGVTSEDSLSFKTQGFYSGKFETERESRIIYKKTLTQNKDWTMYDELLLDVKSITISHGPVYMYFVNGEGENAKNSVPYLVLGQNEITDNVDPVFNGFERRVFDISNQVKNDVREIIFYTDDTVTKHVFWVDNIFLRNQSLFPLNGTIRFRYSSGVPVLFNSINYDALIPDGCDVRVRIRVANSPSLLNRSIFTPNIRSGDVFSLTGTDAEIEVVLVTNADRTTTPVLSKIELQYVIDGEITGFSISTADQWDRGSYINEVQLTDDFNPFISKIEIAQPISVGDLYYIYQNGISQNAPDGSSVIGFKGLTFKDLLSPNQAIKISSSDFNPGFNSPYSLYRLINRNYIIADTLNDRVIEVTQNGDFVRGLGSHYAIDTSALYPLTAVYNHRKGVLTVTFSQNIDSSQIDINKVKLWIGTSNIFLGVEDEIIQNGKTANIVEILLTNDKVEQLEDPKFDVYVDILPGFLPTPFVYSENAKRLISSKGLLVFLGDFVYINDIKRPVFANLSMNGDWMICNSSIKEESSSESSTAITLKVGESTTFTVEAPLPEEGFELRWEQNVPAEIQSIFSFQSPTPGNIATAYLNSPTSDQIRSWKLVFTAIYINTSTGNTVASTANTVILNIISNENSDTPAESSEVASFIQVNFEKEQVEFSFSSLIFSDFTLGSVYEIDSEKIIICGLSKTSDSLPSPEGSSETETYEDQAIRKLSGYKGQALIINRKDKSISFTYDAADNSYPSDAVLDENNRIVIAETSFVGNSGRIIKLDSDSNIVWQISGGMFSKVNDVRAKLSGDVIVST
jgi:hypothetical protein